MGVCPSLSPDERATKESNKMLLKLMMEKLKDLTIYNFSSKLREEIPNIKHRYLFSEGIIDDIEKITTIAKMNQSVRIESVGIETIEEDLGNSCLIMEDEVYREKNNERSLERSFDSGPISNENFEYQKNLAANESLVCQINIIYQRDFDINQYRSSLKLFLKWSSMFQEHFYGGFLKPIYQEFITTIFEMPKDDLESIVDETGIFVQYLVTLYTEIYNLKVINASENGSLFKNENVYNLIMANIFKKTKINRFIREVVATRETQKIDKFAGKLRMLKDKNIGFFGVEEKFQLKELSSSLNESTENSLGKSFEPNENAPHNPYSSCLKLVENLCESSETPITKLKIIVQISKNITTEINSYYDRAEKETPDLDPDNLTGIIMYLIVKTNKSELYQELKIAELFTTTNCLTCISGYYLNTFNAAIESLLVL